ncbi:hypothetical protein FB381_1548 [Nocardioides albertanoniae]|uniref:Sporulation and spore germination protein n=1 Tax=Nocardioides albertanoniae TaxID=1175486 RepID=A0A543A5A3_9ACTN|nr:GerMN domain-containing protein [Nocardioides albertanoniae]TQL67666.1 hypothetical protein FB381_1548 [Nocardioides albertanoniae]
MRPVRNACLAVLTLTVLTLAALTACGAQDPGVETGAEAPTGLADGTPLYFVRDDRLTLQVRETGRLGTIGDAVSLLLTGPGDSGLSTAIDEVGVTRTEVTVSSGVITLRLPLATSEVGPLGVDQLVCTAVAGHVQAGGSPDIRVRLLFTDVASETGPARTCPL